MMLLLVMSSLALQAAGLQYGQMGELMSRATASATWDASLALIQATTGVSVSSAGLNYGLIGGGIVIVLIGFVCFEKLSGDDGNTKDDVESPDEISVKPGSASDNVSDNVNTARDPTPPPSTAFCARSGCGKPSWNGEQGSYCGVDCQTQGIMSQRAAAMAASNVLQMPPLETSEYSGALMPVPNTDALTFSDPRNAAASVGLIAFHYPGRPEVWDEVCCGGFLGNFWFLGPDALTLEAPATPGVKRTFSNAEAAFQALKYWSAADRFRSASGEEALKVRNNIGVPDFNYGGFGCNWAAMYAVLKQKFQEGSELAEALKRTGDSYLLEHNSKKGRDTIWSDNGNGDGTNWLGMQTMLIRDELFGTSKWTNEFGTIRASGTWTSFIVDTCQINLRTGLPGSKEDAEVWQASVLAATRAVSEKNWKAEIAPVPVATLCARSGCFQPPWNGQPGEYCSKDCRQQVLSAQ